MGNGYAACESCGRYSIGSLCEQCRAAQPAPDPRDARIERDLPRFIEGLKDGPLGTEPAEHAALLRVAEYAERIEQNARKQTCQRNGVYFYEWSEDRMSNLRDALAEWRRARGEK